MLHHARSIVSKGSDVTSTFCRIRNLSRAVLRTRTPVALGRSSTRYILPLGYHDTTK